MAGEGGIAVEQDGEHASARLGIIDEALPRTRHALDDRVDGFEVARVWGEEDVDRMAVGCLAGGLEAEVVLDIAIAASQIGDIVFRELVEDDRERLVEKIGEDVEASAVGHPHDDLIDAIAGGGFEEAVEGD